MADLTARIKPKKSSTTGEVPQASDLEVAELAVNTADGKLFVKHTDNSIKEISGGVDSVNGEIGVVSLGVVDMNDYSPRYVSADPAWLMSTTFTNSTQFTGDGQGFLTGGGTVYVYLRKVDADGIDRTSQLMGLQIGDSLTFSWNGGANTNVKDVFGEAPTEYTDFVRIRVNNSTESWSDNQRVEISGGTLSATPTEVPKATGDLLTWNSVTSKFEPTPKLLATVATTGAYSDLSGTPTLVTSINDLTDVDTTTAAPTTGQLLEWDGANWVPGDAPAGAVSSVNGETGVVSLGVQDMDDFKLNQVFGGLSWAGYSSSGNSALTSNEWWSNQFNLIVSPVTTAGDQTSALLGMTGEIILTDASNATFSFTPTNITSDNNGSGGAPRILIAGIGATIDGAINKSGGLTISNITFGALDVPLAEGEILLWNSTESKFKPQAIATVATSGSYNDLANLPTLVTSIDGLTDVDTSTAAPTDGQVLTWDNANGQWEPATPSGSIQTASDFELNPAGTDLTWSTCLGATTISNDPPGSWGAFESGGETTISIEEASDQGDVTAKLQAIQVNDVIAVNGTNRTVVSKSDFLSLQGEMRLSFAGVGYIDNTAGANTLTLSAAQFATGTTPLADGDILQYVAADSAFKPAQIPVDSNIAQAGTGANAINNLVTISQVDYDALGTPDANTVYFIV
ncbi:structural protein [Synechococcus phage S-CBS2]|uniref:structural protein n=1 Tax=Synechococcus phage S-CBS2 TaxID=753084 RepID=UPI00020783F9|nr:structural protein [Synechococcus phage S-CBS2]ADF42388.1 structural protein [Synechococcus phage S-CBS2]